MYLLIGFGTVAATYAALFWMRRGHGGALGRMVRESDHWAWGLACQEIETRIRRLERVATFAELQDLRNRLGELREAEPQLFDGDRRQDGECHG